MEKRYNRELKKLKRKRFIRRVLILSIVFIFIFMTIIYPLFNINIRRYELKKSKLPQSFNNYKIIHVSDLYLKGGDNLSKLKDVIAGAEPNLVVFTGNTFTREDPNYYEEFIKMKDEISESLIFYIARGETELELDEDYSSKLFNKMKYHGIYLIEEEKIALNKGGEMIAVRSIESNKKDYKTQSDDLNIKSSIKFDKKEFNLVLSHNPSYASDLSKKGVDLILSGHRNGGWIRLPFLGGLSYDWDSKFKEDDYILGQSLLIVSRGTGIKNGKFRLFNTKEVNEIILKR
ncbi:MAG: metallophosphoesterase [Tissierellia bacterium]|nr:metallophosphoesterase [Tissierellia bacterium]